MEIRDNEAEEVEEGVGSNNGSVSGSIDALIDGSIDCDNLEDIEYRSSSSSVRVEIIRKYLSTVRFELAIMMER